MAACIAAGTKVLTTVGILSGGAAIATIPGSTTPTSPASDLWGVAIDPTAKPLSDAHKATNGDRTKPGYGGNCSPDEYEKLHDAYKKECGIADGLGACSSSMSATELELRRAANRKCARAREDMMNKCFAGGDYNHRQQAGNVWNAYKNCGGR